MKKQTGACPTILDKRKLDEVKAIPSRGPTGRNAAQRATPF